MEVIKNHLPVRSLPLEDIHLLSIRNRELQQDNKLNFEVNLSKDWIPREFVPLSYLPSFNRLSEEEKRQCNQLYAMAICEQFIWFERDLISPILETMIERVRFPRELRVCLENFVEEEYRHSEMFENLLRVASPKMYDSFKYNFVNPKLKMKSLVSILKARPEVFPLWIWMAVYFEERTLHISQIYREKSRNCGQIDLGFAKAHAIHLIDESHHVQLDQYLLASIYDKKSMLVRRLTAWSFEKMLRAYIAPTQIGARVLEILTQKCSSKSLVIDNLKAELSLISKSEAYFHFMFSEKAIPRTHKLLRYYPEMRSATSLLTTSSFSK